MKYFAIHDEQGNVRRVVGRSGEAQPDARGLLMTEIPDSQYRIRKGASGEFEPYLPESDAIEPSMLRTSARRRIAALEARAARPLRELAVDPGNAEARGRLEAIESEIKALRGNLTEA